MPVDSDSAIAWHRAQLKKLRETLKNIETSRFTVGEPAQSSRTGKTQKAVAELEQKIRQSQHIIAAYERQTRRPLATDQRSLASVSWSSWNAQAAHSRRQFAVSLHWPEHRRASPAGFEPAVRYFGALPMRSRPSTVRRANSWRSLFLSPLPCTK